MASSSGRDHDTGEIIDIDLELNGTVKWSFSTPPAADGYDLQSVLLHEVGHTLGIAHSSEPYAVMFLQATPGEVRTLAADDRNALCTVYPSRTQRLSPTGLVALQPCSLAPDNPDGTCGDPGITHGCSTTPQPEPGSSAAAIGTGLLFAFGTLAMARRKARSR